MINTKRPNTSDYTQVGFVEAKDTQGNYQNIDHIYDTQGNIVFQQGYLNEYQGADNFSIPAIGKPLLDYTIYGNMYQASGVSPTTPIQPQETGERTGNLFNINGETYLIAPSIIVDKNEIKFENVPKGNGARIFYSAQYPAGTYYMSCVTSGYDYYATRLFSDQPFPGATHNTFFNGYYYDFPQGGFSTFLTFDNDFKLGFGANAKGGATFTISDIMLSTTEADYEPYGYKIPISSAGQTNNIYLGEVETTRKIKKLVLTGEENYNEISGAARFQLFLPTNRVPDPPNVISNFYQGLPRGSWGNYDYFVSAYISYGSIVFRDIRFSDKDSFVAWIAQQYAAGTPVTIWYVLAEPETAVVNEPLRKIGDYADTLSMEQAGAQIPTVKGNTVIDVLTEVEPSEIDVTYRGSTKPKYDLFLAQNGDSFEAKDGQSLYIGGGL